MKAATPWPRSNRNSVQSLSVAMDGSGETYTTQGGLFSQMLIASAGYLGSMAFGALLLVLIREARRGANRVGRFSLLLFGLTLAFGLIKPIVAGGVLSGIPFTVVAGVVLSVGLLALARFASPRVGGIFASLLAVQCVLNALFDLRTLFFLSSPFSRTPKRMRSTWRTRLTSRLSSGPYCGSRSHVGSCISPCGSCRKQGRPGVTQPTPRRGVPWRTLTIRDRRSPHHAAVREIVGLPAFTFDGDVVMNPTRLTGSRAVRVCLEEVGFDLRDRHSGLYERPGVDFDMRRATRI